MDYKINSNIFLALLLHIILLPYGLLRLRKVCPKTVIAWMNKKQRCGARFRSAENEDSQN